MGETMNSWRFRLAKWLMDRRAAVAAVFVLVTIGFAAGIPSVEIRTIFSDLLPEDDPFVQTFKDHPGFGNPLSVTIMVKRVDGQTIYNAETLQKVWDLTRDIDLTPGVNHDAILSITTEKARYAEATPMGINMRPLMGDKVPSDPETLASFHKRVERSPAARQYLVSEDGKATLINAAFYEHSLEYDTVFDFVNGIAAKARDENHEVHVVGQPVLTGWVYQLQEQTYAIFGITLLLLLIALIFYMKNVAGVAVPVIVSLVSGIWGFGLVGWINSVIEPLLMIVPLLLVARSFSHCVQFTERYYEILEEVPNKRRAAEITMGVMMAPSTLGIITDTLGIAFIGLAPIPAMERFALFTGFWALCFIPTGVVLISILLSYLPTPKNARDIIGGNNETGLHAAQRGVLLQIAKRVTGKRARATALVMLAVSVVATWTSFKIEIGNPVEGSNLLWPISEFNQGVRAVNDSFPGVNSLEIVIDSKDDNSKKRTARSEEFYRVSREIQRIAERADGPGELPARVTRSFSDYIEDGNRLFSGGHPKWLPIDPDDRAVAAGAMAISFGQNAINFASVSDFKFQNATVSLYYRDNKQDTVDGALAVARRAVETVGADHEGFTVRLASGTIALQEAMNRVVERYHYLILALLAFAIFWIATFAYRSPMGAIIVLIPVALSNFYLTATMHVLGIGLDINSVMVAVLGVGVGIDYGIYLLSRICEEYGAQDGDWERALTVAISTTGKAIMFTASIMLLGIMPWYFLSDLKFMADMGLLLAAIMLINMVLALVVLPLLVWFIKPRFVTREDLMVGENVDLTQFKDLAPPLASAQPA